VSTETINTIDDCKWTNDEPEPVGGVQVQQVQNDSSTNVNARVMQL
jgi:hypothetical protein